ncbi:MAG TPA: hypothetical protein ENN63_00680 [Bacteroidetes bacterium]|nr:hypothetical protein [Bacteroidota bacterium]
MKKLIYCTLALWSVFVLSCQKDDENGSDEKTSFVVPGDFISIQAAIDASADGDTIFVQPGIYEENIDFKGKNVMVCSFDPGDPEVIATTIIDGRHQGTVVTMNSGETESAVLTGFTIRNGDAGTSNGGGIFISNTSNPVIENNMIVNNTAQYGGGICIRDQSNPVIKNNVFAGNSADGGRGAAVYAIDKSSVTIDNNIFKDHLGADGVIHIGSTSTDESSAVISNNTIENNTTEFGTGGIKVTAVSAAEITFNTITGNTGSGDNSAAGITISKNSFAVITDNVITDNTAIQNGAIVVYDESEAVITGNTISGNSAGSEENTSSGTGGAISVTYNSKADISNNTISENYAWNLNHGGGGIIISYSSEATIDNNEIINNKAYRFGGGIYVRQNYNYVTITNNYIYGNEATGYGASNGGGMYLRNIVEAVVYDNTLSNNWAEKYGGGIYVYNNVESLTNSEGTEWIRINYPPETEPYNEYVNNTHGDDTYQGANVFFDN